MIGPEIEFFALKEMDLPQEIDDYIKDSIDHSLGLPLSTKTLELKLSVSQEAQLRLRNRCLSLQYKLREKDELIDRIRVRTFQFYPFCVCMYVSYFLIQRFFFFFSFLSLMLLEI